MTSRNKWAIVIAAALCAAAFALLKGNFFAGRGSDLKSVSIDLNKKTYNLVMPLKFFESIPFYEGVTWAEQNRKEIDFTQSPGGIAPHHLFPGKLLSEFFQNLAAAKPDVIVLIGPNHYERGGFNILTSLAAWQTPFGEVEADLETVNSFLSSGTAKTADKALAEEHSMGGIMPYIKFYLPEAKVVPVVLSSSNNLKQDFALAEELEKITKNKKVFFLAVVDFSHYLDSEIAKKNDQITLKAMKEFDYKAIYKMNNGFVDSPPSIIVLLKIMEILEKKDLVLLQNTNSGIMQNKPFEPTTSYFTAVFK